jgi:hypothetical protein
MLRALCVCVCVPVCVDSVSGTIHRSSRHSVYVCVCVCVWIYNLHCDSDILFY